MGKLADKRFHLPHDYDAGLHSIAEKLSHERLNSRALLIDEVKKDVTKQFSEQVETLEKQLKRKNEEFLLKLRKHTRNRAKHITRPFQISLR